VIAMFVCLYPDMNRQCKQQASMVAQAAVASSTCAHCQPAGLSIAESRGQLSLRMSPRAQLNPEQLPAGQTIEALKHNRSRIGTKPIG
jgi:hypothetical protein